MKAVILGLKNGVQPEANLIKLKILNAINLIDKMP
jgi:hypothetical protein